MPSLSAKAPCSLPALRIGERDRPRDGVPEAVFVISASAVPRAGGEGPGAETPARTGPSTTKPRPLATGAPVNHQAPRVGRATLNGSAFVAVRQLVRCALGGTGSLRSHRPENANACESRWLGDASRDALSDSRGPAPNAGAKRDGRAHVGRWRGAGGARGPAVPRRRPRQTGATGALSPRPERPLDVADRDEPR